MTDNNTNEMVLRSNITMEECRRIEKILRNNNISYYEKWNNKGFTKLFGSSKNSRCDIYIHKDSMEEAKKALEMEA